MAAKKVLKLLVKAKSGGKRVKYFKTKKSYNRWLKEGKGKVPGGSLKERSAAKIKGKRKALVAGNPALQFKELSQAKQYLVEAQKMLGEKAHKFTDAMMTYNAAKNMKPSQIRGGAPALKKWKAKAKKEFEIARKNQREFANYEKKARAKYDSLVKKAGVKDLGKGDYQDADTPKGMWKNKKTGGRLYGNQEFSAKSYKRLFE